MVELFELPNGQWQFGKGRDATVITSMEQIAMVSDPGIRKDIEAWIEKTKGQALQPVQQGGSPVVGGETVQDQLIYAITHMPGDAQARMLEAIKQVMQPIAHSLAQPAPANHYSDGFGQDQQLPPPASIPFVLPEGAKWAQEGNPASGYLVPDLTMTDEKGQHPMRWHQTPQFTQFLETAPDKTSVELEMEAEREKHQERELVGAGSGRSRTRRR